MRLASSTLVKLSLLIGMTSLLAFHFVDDTPFSQQLTDRFLAYHQQRPIEKVYIHTDRETYLIGETIWLKGYLVDGATHEADTLSRVLYVDLIDPIARKVRLRTQLRATSSYAPGQLLLPDSLPAGTYQLRGYTNFMRNESEAYFFAKTLRILPTDRATDKLQLAPSGAGMNQVDVQFLPESGQLVEGISSRIAFKALNPLGQSTDIKGFVLDAKKDTVVNFASVHLGMGSFYFKPEAGQQYEAFVQRQNGAIVPYPLPTVQKQGVVLQVDNSGGKDLFRVYVQHNKISASPTDSMTLFAQTRGQVVHVITIPLSKKASLIKFAKADFPEGITQLTLFDETHKPVCERLAFVHNDEPVTITLTPDKATYKNREKVELGITTTNAQGNPVPANLSLAALDSRLTPEADSNKATIVSHLLLSSDLTGTIEQPGYYFDPAQKDRWRHLDLLLMTQGWRRFTWTDVVAGTVPPITHPLERGLSLTGRVVRPNRKDIGGKVTLTFLLTKRDSTREFLFGETNEIGQFGAYNLAFTDTTTVLIQGVKQKTNRNLVISLDQLLTPVVTITQILYNPFEFRGDELAEFTKRTREYLDLERQSQRNGEVLLQAVTVKAKKYQEKDSRVYYGTPDASFKFDQLNTSGRQTVLDVIQGRIAGVQINGSGVNVTVQIRGEANFSGPVLPLFLLDGVPLFVESGNLQAVLSIPVQDVDRVDVLKGASTAIYGARGAGGVISILTKQGVSSSDFSKEMAPGTLIAKLPGYAPVREFYTPRYDQPKPEHARPDYRPTLFWAPMIQTNREGKATVSFFTSDNKTAIRLCAEGLTTNGVPGVGERKINVE